MPTFRSIGVIPTVSKRFVTESVVVHSKASENDNDNDNNNVENNENDSMNKNSNKKQKRKKNNNNQYYSIETPHAMLCRNPASIKMLKTKEAKAAKAATTITIDQNTGMKKNNNVEDKINRKSDHDDINNNNDETDCVNDNHPLAANTIRQQQQQEQEKEQEEHIVDCQQHAETIPLQHVLNMKYDIAVSMMRQSYNGNVLKHIRNEINRPTKRMTHNPDNNNNSSGRIHDAFAFPGTISVFEMIQYHKLIPEKVHNQQLQEQQQQTIDYSNNDRIKITTGCTQIDELIAIPEEYTTIAFSSSSCQNTTKSVLLPLDSSSTTKKVYYGVPMGYVTQVSGPSGCGKTQLAIQLAANSIGIYQTWYLSSDASVHIYAQRLAQLAYQCHNNNNNNNNNSSVNDQQQQQQQDDNSINWMNTVLERTHFSHVTNEYEVLAELNRLDSFLLQKDDTNQSNSNNENNSIADDSTSNICRRPIILVIDSVAGCITPGDNNNNNNNTSSLLPTVANTIKRITRLHSIVTFIINGTVSSSITHNKNVTKAGSNTTGTGSSIENIQPLIENQFPYNHHQRTTKPALGRTWLKSAIDIQLWIEMLPNGLLRISLDRHPSKKVMHDTTSSSVDGTDTSNDKANPHSVLFRLSEKGVCSVL